MWRLLTWLYDSAPPTDLQIDIINHLVDDRKLLDDDSYLPPQDHDGVPWVPINVGEANTIIAWLLQRPPRAEKTADDAKDEDQSDG